MIFLKKFEDFNYKFKIEDIYESMSMWYQNILNSIGAQEVNMNDVFGTDKFNKFKIEQLDQSPEFIETLHNNNLRKDHIENTEDYETFLSKPCKYIIIYDIGKSSLEKPTYILFQSWNNTTNKWDDVKMYEIHDDIKKFYDKLSSKTIELIYNGEKYIYQTSNANEWILKNRQPTNVFHKTMRTADFEKMINSIQVKINII